VDRKPLFSYVYSLLTPYAGAPIIAPAKKDFSSAGIDLLQHFVEGTKISFAFQGKEF